VGGLSNIAEDLGTFLDEAVPDLVELVELVEAPRAITAEGLDALAGGVLDLVFAKAEPGDSSAMLGEAAVIGALAAAHDFGQHDASVAVALVERLERMAAGARSALTEITAPSAQDKLILKAIKGLKTKHVSAKAAAEAASVQLKAAITALNRLQAAGFVDYNLKTGYTVPR